ncbi:hypothetical protein [Bacillus subtilis]|uniref:hypothetical protein n=1 Tax=Bacillus subtilis TaxID=1423 RepID=UPI00129E21B7|nr:hypothetical protein [Bacillus subtilis]QGI15776.1 hypothetical protein GII80_22200 [Bacillus subtilis]
MFYRIGTIKTRKEGEHEVDIKRDFTQEEQEKYFQYRKYLGLHINNKNLYNLIVRNGEEFEHFLDTIKDKDPSEIGSPDYVVFEANRLFMNYLSMIRTYIDHIPSSLSKTFDSKVKDEFDEFLSVIYDNYFEYRFLYKLRNLAQHFGIPISNLISNEQGNHITMSQSYLLSYKKLGTVKEEVKNMEESIPVKGLALRMNVIMNTVYLFVMKFYVEGIIESLKWFDSLQGELGGSTILAVSDSPEEYGKGKFNFQPMNTDEFINAVHDLNENPGINIELIE